ncbi:transaldolase [Cohaesibacter celericrescens]|uniref:Transaldolase n=1 Tax=Cohaesibacter celericrescens TaxID=2067669 RepID=A0A2N5XPV4_9HYPH|nr:transaldolase [Cohaesibacter celericrescens]PLW76556.1 transaldolase [Cohaesibacter celericrescens]
MENKLDQLRKMTVVVADTGDIEAVARLKPVDCTTNPSIVLNTIDTEMGQELLNEAVHWSKSSSLGLEKATIAAADRLAVSIGSELAKLVPGHVSTEVDADLSFDTEASITKAHEIIAAYGHRGIDQDRILIKLASTWEGICAAEVLEKEGINCNLTLLFSTAQAVACADAGAFLISPFVGRILDWHKKATGEAYTSENDPGVLSVRSIFNYYKVHDVKTVVMGASFRNAGEIEALAGCDRLTIAPKFLEELSLDNGHLERVLSPENSNPVDRIGMDEKTFRWMLNEDAMATEKLSEGIRAFAKDLGKLRALIARELES